MDKDRFREILDALGWGQNELARIMNRDPRLIRRWSTGQVEIDPESAAWLEMQAAHPPPHRRQSA